MRDYQQRARNKQLNAIKARRHPTKHSRADRYHIAKALQQIEERINHYLAKFEAWPDLALWPYEHVVTVKDEELMADRFGVLHRDDVFKDDSDPDELTWHLRAFQDRTIKNTNVIHVVTWYRGVDAYEDLAEMLIIKPIYSPLPCDSWGALPLTFTQWCKVAQALTLIHSKHQWTQAVRHYASNDTMHFAGIGGWYMTLANKVQTYEQMKEAGTFLHAGDQVERAEPWIGHIIYSDIIEQFSKRVAGE